MRTAPVSESPDLPPAYLPPQPIYPVVPPPVYPYAYPTPVPVRTPMSGARIADIVATVLVGTLQVALSVIAVFWSFFFPDGVGLLLVVLLGADCSDGLMVAAYGGVWGGVALAAALALTGVLIGALRGRLMFVWPLLGTLIVVIGTVVGTHLAEAAGGL